MESIQFQARIGADQLIRPPHGVVIPEGDIVVSVRPVRKEEPRDDDFEAMAPTRAYLLAAAAEFERLAPDLPSDLAENHDHYIHGKPKP